ALGSRTLAQRPDQPGAGPGGAQDEHRRGDDGADDRGAMAPDEPGGEVADARRARGDGLVPEEAAEVVRQGAGGAVAARAVLLEAPHDDPVQVAAQLAGQLALAGGGQAGVGGGGPARDAGAGALGLGLLDGAGQLGDAARAEGGGVE